MPKFPKILYACSHDLSEPFGPSINEREFLLNLIRAHNQSVSILIPKPKNNLEQVITDRSHFIRSYQHKYGVGWLFSKCSCAYLVWRMIKCNLPELIIVRPTLLPLELLPLVVSKKTYIVKMGGSLEFLRRYKGVKSLLGHIIYPVNKLLHRILMSKACAIETCTEELKNYYRKLLPNRKIHIYSLPNATNLNRFMPSFNDSEDGLVQKRTPVLGYVGGRPQEFGGQYLLYSLAALQTTFPNIGAVIVGQHSMELMTLATKLGVLDRCTFTGQVTYDKIPSLMRKIDIGFAIVPPCYLQSDGNSFQKIRQYIACGIPVITSGESAIDLDGEGLGSNLDSVCLETITRACRYWLGYIGSNRRAFAFRAYHFAQQHLSTEVAHQTRLQYWSDCLPERLVEQIRA